MISLRDWAMLPGQSLLDVECWTIARVYSPTRQRAAGYAMFTAPCPYRVLWFERLEEIAVYLRKPLDEIQGTLYSDTDWAREVAGVS